MKLKPSTTRRMTLGQSHTRRIKADAAMKALGAVETARPAIARHFREMPRAADGVLLWEVYERVDSIDEKHATDQYLSRSQVFVAARTWFRARELAMIRTHRGPDDVLLIQIEIDRPLAEGTHIIAWRRQDGDTVLFDRVTSPAIVLKPNRPLFQARFGEACTSRPTVIEYRKRDY